MSTHQEAISPITTDLIGKTIRQQDGAGTLTGTCRAVFLHRDSAGTPEMGMILELEGGRLLSTYCGTHMVIHDQS